MSATPVADGVWRVTRGFPLRVNVFLIREGAGVAVFDAGLKQMGKAVRAAADELGGATRVVLGNAHADHRGGARAIGAPVQCHADERADVEGDGGAHYFDYSKLPAFARPLTPRMMSALGRRPARGPEHARRGRRRRRLQRSSISRGTARAASACGASATGWRSATTASRCSTRRCPAPGSPRVPHEAFNWSTERCRESIAKLAALEPATCWPGHFGPLTGDVAAQLRGATG